MRRPLLTLPPGVFLRPAARAAATASGLLATAALIGATVRVLPWLLDPSLPLSVVRPFARSLAAISVEAALLTGWAIGFAVASHRFAERDEARVLALLGERPGRTISRLTPACVGFAALLALASYFAGLDAREPGRIVTDLMSQGEIACARAPAPTTYTVPFAEAVWLCVPGERPRLAAHGPGPMHSVMVTATHVRFTDDLRGMEIENAKLLFGNVAVDARQVVLRGLPPWSSASDLPVWLRALVVACAGFACSLVAPWAVLVFRERTLHGHPRFARASVATAIVLGASGPLAALGVLRALERSLPDAPSGAVLARFALVPAAGAVTTLIFLMILLRLPKLSRAATRGA